VASPHDESLARCHLDATGANRSAPLRPSGSGREEQQHDDGERATRNAHLINSRLEIAPVSRFKTPSDDPVSRRANFACNLLPVEKHRSH